MPSTSSSTASEKCSWEVSFDKNKFTKDEEGNYENVDDILMIVIKISWNIYLQSSYK